MPNVWKSHSPYISQFPQLPLKAQLSVHNDWEPDDFAGSTLPGVDIAVVVFKLSIVVHNDGRPDDFAGFSQCREISSSSARAAPLSRTDWALHAAVPASKLRTRSLLVLHSGTDQKPLHLRCPSFLLGHTASAGLPWSRPDLSYTVCALPTQGLKAPEAHTPSALIRARDKARKGHNFWNPPFSGRGCWALGWGLFLLNKQTFLRKAHFLESQTALPERELRNFEEKINDELMVQHLP